MLTVGAAFSASAETIKTIKFDTRDSGESKSITEWGIDNTWASWHNTRESIDNAGEEIDFVRVGFYMTEPYNEDGSLSFDQINKLKEAVDFAEMVDPRVPIMISPHNEEGIIDWYKNSDGSVRIDRWLHVMEKTRDYIERRGHKVVYVEAFNEPDYSQWNMGKKEDLDELFKELKKWKALRVGPSVMNAHNAESWYDEIKKNIDAGSTHTLYGSMDEFIDFIEEVKGDRKEFFCAESHSIAEAMIAADLGVDYMLWWGPINEARGEFVRACQGSRLAYVEVKDNFSAASVYRGPDRKLYGFAGTAERENGVPTTYKFVCTDEDVTYYLDGDMTNGHFREKGEAFKVQAKPDGQGPISRWVKIVPGEPKRR